jgi:DNA-directed RNA polymerase specialized sigma24 family protein
MDFYKEHKRWVSYAKIFGAGIYAEDIVQDAYIKAYEKKIVQVPHFYVILRNMVVDFHRQNKKEIILLPENENEKIIETVYDYINTWYWYDRDMYLMHIDQQLTLRQISNRTKISLASVHKTIKHCNEKLKKWYQIYGEN